MAEHDDTELVERALNILLHHGRLLATRPMWVGGVMHHAGNYALTYLGPAPEDLQNSDEN